MKDKTDKRPIHITINMNIFVNDGEEGTEEVMAKVDELQASFDELDAAVREFLQQGGNAVSTLQQELDKLRADDAVEDTKLDGIKNGIQNITQAIRQLTKVEPPEGSEPYPDQTLPGDLPA